MTKTVVILDMNKSAHINKAFLFFSSSLSCNSFQKKKEKSEGSAQTDAVAKLEFINRGHPFSLLSLCFLSAEQ